MRKVMTSWAVPRKQYNTRLRISLEVPVLNLAPELYITKEPNETVK